MSPEWEVHRKWGELLFDFSDSEIDKLIDLQQHDAGRYDSHLLEQQLNYVHQEWGEVGVAYYILHHLLDRAEDILLSEMCSKLDVPQLPAPDKFMEELIESFRMDFEKDGKSLMRHLEETQWFYDVFGYRGALCSLVYDLIDREKFGRRLAQSMTTKSVAQEHFPKSSRHSKSRKVLEEYIPKVINELGRCIREKHES